MIITCPCEKKQFKIDDDIGTIFMFLERFFKLFFNSLFPRICAVDAVGIGATSRELRIPIFAFFWDFEANFAIFDAIFTFSIRFLQIFHPPWILIFSFRASQSQRPLSGVTPQRSNCN